MKKTRFNHSFLREGCKLLNQKIKKALLFAYFIFLASSGQAIADNLNFEDEPPILLEQSDKTVRGTVSGTDGQGIPGVTVMIKGTTIGTTSGADGQYILKNIPDGVVLVFSFIGMETQEIPLKKNLVIDVVMKSALTQLEEVVAVGYGKQEKISVTGSVAAVKTELIKQSPSPNVIGALTGQLPGLTTIQSSGRPGAEGYSIYLRGLSTTNGAQPLILVDGIPRDNITQLDPNEIESLTVLKDASATAVFGVRGANGVILVTTRVGQNEKPSISFTYEFGLQHLTYKTEMLDSWDYAEMRNQALINDGYAPKYTERQIGLMKAGTSPFYPNTDWYDIMLNDFAPMSRYNVNMSGGNDRFKYFFNAGVLNQKSFYDALSKDEVGYDPQFKLNRYNFRTNVEMKVNKWISAGVKLAGYVDKVNGTTSKASQVYVGINSMTPVTPGPLSPAGWEEYGIPEGYPITPDNVSNKNPYDILNFRGYNSSESDNLNTTAYVDFDLSKITKGLSSKVMASFDTYSSSSISGSKSNTSYQFDINEQETLEGEIYDAIQFTPEEDLQFYPISLSKSSSFRYSSNLQWVINYNRTFNKIHKVTGMVLAQRDNKEVASGSSENLLPYNYMGVAGRGTYRLKNRYLAEFNIGYNGSEQFAKGNRYGIFPAGSVGWVLSNEPFVKSLNVFSNLKVRASYGKVGSDNIGGSRFLYLDKMNVKTSGAIKTISDLFVSENLLGNPNITWEVAYKQNYGIDMGFLKNTLTLSVDAFKERRENILITRQTVSDVTGLADIYPKANLGIVDNKGFEVEMEYKKRLNNDFFFSIRNTFAYAINKNVFADEASKGDNYYQPYTKQGLSIGQYTGMIVDWDSEGNGYYISEEEINQTTYSGATPRLGDLKYKDLNEDGNIGAEDKDVIGYPTVPRINYSSRFSFSYKGFDLSLMFQGAAQVTKNFTAAGVWEYGDPGYYFAYQKNAWTQERWDNGEEISYPALSSYKRNTNHTINSYYTTDVSYLRLKNAEFGYTFSKNLCSKLGIEKVRVYTNGSNLITWANNRFSHLDPEIGRSPLIPITQIFNFGVNVTF
ncbi:SusC/RagA family TonB-linked outer membrane protein [Saccharicrinis sp. 156]|uniref:SusC/RagA family TonB-linked outer membrane protein n=1 Tax=Saccharicrinis sp. 156 TaxID=3417574 RepID=UPI003D333E73